MKFRSLLAATLLATSAFAQPLRVPERGSSDWIVHTFFSDKTFPDSAKFYSGEMRNYVDQAPMGAYVTPGFHLETKVLSESAGKKIYRATYSKTPKAKDWYAYLTQEPDGWKLTAVRCLALPPFVEKLHAELAAKSSRTSEEETEYQNMRLLFLSDAELRAHFKANATQLTTLAKAVTDGLPQETIDQQVKALHFTSASVHSRGCILITIGGILDNSVGYLFIPAGKSSPGMTPEEFILIEPIQDGWFLFKTT